MDRHPHESLTTESAKQQLRAAAERLGLARWVRHQPKSAMVTGVIAGFVLGRMPRVVSRVSHSRVGQRVFDRFV